MMMNKAEARKKAKLMKQKRSLKQRAKETLNEPRTNSKSSY